MDGGDHGPNSADPGIDSRALIAAAEAGNFDALLKEYWDLKRECWRLDYEKRDLCIRRKGFPEVVRYNLDFRGRFSLLPIPEILLAAFRGGNPKCMFRALRIAGDHETFAPTVAQCAAIALERGDRWGASQALAHLLALRDVDHVSILCVLFIEMLQKGLNDACRYVVDLKPEFSYTVRRRRQTIPLENSLLIRNAWDRVDDWKRVGRRTRRVDEKM